MKTVTTKLPPDRLAFKVRELPLLVPVSYATIRRQITLGRLKCVKGMKGIVAKTEIERWLAERNA